MHDVVTSVRPCHAARAERLRWCAPQGVRHGECQVGGVRPTTVSRRPTAKGEAARIRTIRPGARTPPSGRGGAG